MSNDGIHTPSAFGPIQKIFFKYNTIRVSGNGVYAHTDSTILLSLI